MDYIPENYKPLAEFYLENMMPTQATSTLDQIFLVSSLLVGLSFSILVFEILMAAPLTIVYLVSQNFREFVKNNSKFIRLAFLIPFLATLILYFARLVFFLVIYKDSLLI